MQRFLDAAQAIIIEKSTDFTVQEVVDRSRQSLRSFYLQFDGKRAVARVVRGRAQPVGRPDPCGDAGQTDPIERLKVAIELLFSRPADPSQATPVHGLRAAAAGVASVRGQDRACAVVGAAHRADGRGFRGGLLRKEINPKRWAAMTMQTVMFVAQSSGSDDATVKPISAEEVWDFCAHGFAVV